jgi:cytochrome c-type biogenesis protein CcmF
VPFVALIAAMVLGSIGLVIWRRDALRSEARLDSLLSREAAFLAQNLVLVSMMFVIFWVTFFPLISEAITGTRVSVGPPAFRPFIVPLALVLVALAGIGPIISWRRVTVANLRRNFTLPVLAGLGTLIGLLVLSDAANRPRALILFALAAFVVCGVFQELWRGVGARRAASGESSPIAFGRLIRRNRRRYGGYIVHAGLAVLLVGVAASSSFAHSADVILKPGQTASVGGYAFRYVRPVESVSPQKLSFGAILDVSRHGRHVKTLETVRGFYPSTDSVDLGPIGRFFGGQADSDVGLSTGPTHDIWTVVNVDLSPLQTVINRGNTVFGNALMQAMNNLAARHVSQKIADQELQPLWQLRDAAVGGIARQYLTHPWAVNFLLIVSPLVLWIWIGAGIIAAGGLIALWPLPAPARRRARAARSAASPLPGGAAPAGAPAGASLAVSERV